MDLSTFISNLSWAEIFAGLTALVAAWYSAKASYRTSKMKTTIETKSTEKVSIQDQMTAFMTIVTDENKAKAQEIVILTEKLERATLIIESMEQKLVMAAAEIAGLKSEVQRLRTALAAHEALG